MPDHVMPLPTGLVALLRTIGPGEPDNLAFPGAAGAVIGNWSKWTREIKARLGIDVTPHAFRRTFTTLLGEVGAPPHVGSAALGHAPGDATASATTKRPISPSASSTSVASPIGSTCLKRARMLSRCRGAHKSIEGGG